MKYWWSSETSTGVTEASGEILKIVDLQLNDRLSLTQLEAKWDGWEWSFISIIISPSLGLELRERILCSKKRKDFEFRLKIDFDEFLTADRAKRVDLVFQQLHRSVDLMEKYSVSRVDRGALHQALDTISGSV